MWNLIVYHVGGGGGNPTVSVSTTHAIASLGNKGEALLIKAGKTLGTTVRRVQEIHMRIRPMFF